MIRGNEAVIRTGMPMSHGHAFQQVANARDCVIVVRAVGRWATGLLLESYASKGFHNKAKSCNWGPMAGFVLVDPRFTKGGNPADQAVADGAAAWLRRDPPVHHRRASSRPRRPRLRWTRAHRPYRWHDQ